MIHVFMTFDTLIRIILIHIHEFITFDSLIHDLWYINSWILIHTFKFMDLCLLIHKFMSFDTVIRLFVIHIHEFKTFNTLIHEFTNSHTQYTNSQIHIHKFTNSYTLIHTFTYTNSQIHIHWFANLFQVFTNASLIESQKKNRVTCNCKLNFNTKSVTKWAMNQATQTYKNIQMVEVTRTNVRQRPRLLGTPTTLPACSFFGLSFNLIFIWFT